MRRLLPLACSMLACGGPRIQDIDFAPPRPRYLETRETVHDLAVELMKANEVTGISLALVDEGEVVWATGWGWADVDRKLAAGPRTLYAMGSLAKPVTAAALMQAVEEGELALDDTLRELLPEVELAGDVESSITLADLLSHRSGLPSDWFVHDLSEEPPPWPRVAEEIEGLELAGPPGGYTLYSNLGMSLAGLALAHVHERDFESLVTERLLRPAGMRTAYYADGPGPEPVLIPLGDSALEHAEHAMGYRRTTARHDPQFRLAPAGGLRGSVLDLASFAALILGEGRSSTGERLLSPASVEALLRGPESTPALDLDQRFGYGWFLDHAELDWAGRVAWHSGRTQFHQARMILLPDHGLAVVVASNSLTASRALDTLAVQTLRSALFEKHGIEGPAPATAASAPDPSAHLDTFLLRHGGAWTSALGLATIELQGGEVWLASAFGRTPLELLGDDRARMVGDPNGEFGFAHVEGLDLLTVTRGGRVRRSGVRLPEPSPIPAAWAERVGTWQVVERSGEVTTMRQPELRIVEGRLELRYLGLLEWPPLPLVDVLIPLDDRRARIAGISRGQGTVIEVRGEGRAERLWWSGRELRRAHARPADDSDASATPTQAEQPGPS